MQYHFFCSVYLLNMPTMLNNYLQIIFVRFLVEKVGINLAKLTHNMNNLVLLVELRNVVPTLQVWGLWGSEFDS